MWKILPVLLTKKQTQGALCSLLKASNWQVQWPHLQFWFGWLQKARGPWSIWVQLQVDRRPLEDRCFAAASISQSSEQTGCRGRRTLSVQEVIFCSVCIACLRFEEGNFSILASCRIYASCSLHKQMQSPRGHLCTYVSFWEYFP